MCAVAVAGAVYHIPAGRHPDYPAVEVLNDLLTEKPAGRLYKSMVESKKASSVEGWSLTLHDPGAIIFWARVPDTDSMDDARAAMEKPAASLGVEVIDVQLTRVDFPASMADTVFKRMIAAREQAAAQERAQGVAEADKIKADAAQQQQALLADAYQQAQGIKGDGDGKAASIAADAYSRDPQFYQFYKSMQAYRNSFKPNSRRHKSL